MVVKCPACGATFDYEKLLSLRPRMVQVKIVERQPANTLPLTIWVYPEPLEAMRQRFPSNFMTTMTAMFTAVADPDTVLIEGEHGRALKESGVLRGRDVEGLGPYIKQLEQDVEDAKVRERALGPLMAMMQMMQGAAGQGAGGLVYPASLPNQVPAQTVIPANPFGENQSADFYEEPDPFGMAALPMEPQSPARTGAGGAGTGTPATAADPGTTMLHGLPKPVPSGR